MHRLLFSACLLLPALALAPLAVSAPKEGNWSSDKNEISPQEPWKKTMTFRGGERAGVLVIGSPKDSVALRVAVYDKDNQLVAQDKGAGPLTGNFAGVVWYPPHDGAYRIEVTNLSTAACTCYIAIK